MSASTPHIFALLDRSLSMEGKQDEMARGFNVFCAELASGVSATPETPITIIAFNSTVQTIYSGPLTKTTPRITSQQLFPSGWTSLFDALGPVLEPHQLKPRTTVLIATDGEDTSSALYSGERIAQLIAEAKRDFGTRFIFLAEGDEAFTSGAALGLTTQTTTTKRIYSASVASEQGLGSALSSPAFIASASQMVFDVSSDEEYASKRRAVSKPDLSTLNSPSL